MTSVLIVGNARQESLSKWSELIEKSDLIIACDGALTIAWKIIWTLTSLLETWIA